MELNTHETDLKNNVVINTTSMTCLGSQLRNMPIPSPPSISSSSEDDSDDLSEDDDSAPLECFLQGNKNDLTTRLLLTEEDVNRDLSNLTLVGPETQARLEALLAAAGVAADGKTFTDPEVLRRLTSSVSSALDEAAAALTRMRSQAGNSGSNHINDQGTRSLVEACIEGDIAAVRKLLDEGRSVHEPTDEGESLLSLACSAGYYELVQVLLAMNANVEDRGSKGDCTPLMEAASGGFVDILRLLLQHGANVNAQSSSGNTALHYACCSGFDHIVQVLIQHNADLEHQNENGHTPLMEAASGGHVKVAKLLLDNGAGINTHSSEFKESALTLACYKGHVEMVEFLLERGADQEHKTDEMHTALMEASMDGHVEVARLLLDHGAQVNMPADSFESPLTLAACGSHVELAQLLIEHGASLEEVNDEGYTPLMEAAREGYLPMVALLLDHGANINAQTDETQETALTLACCGGFQEVVSYLLDCGADIELGASTPLMEAATEGHVDLVAFILEKGANVNATTATGDAALTYAAENGHTDVAEVLVEHNANIEHESEGGRTPLMKAARAGHLCTVEFLISKGADVNRRTAGDDHSVLSLACAGGHAAVVELLLGRCANPGLKLKDNSSMLIEAAKGGHTAVACLLIDTPPHHHNYLPPNSPVHAGYPSPVSSAAPGNHSSFRTCQHMPSAMEHHLHQIQQQQQQQQHDCCQHQCLHAPLQQACFGHNSTFVPPVIQPSPLSPHNFTNMPSPIFDGQSFMNDIDVNTSPTELFPPNIPNMSIGAQLSLANLTPADLQSLAQALSFSTSVNSMLQADQQQQLHQQQQVMQFLQQQQMVQEQQQMMAKSAEQMMSKSAEHIPLTSSSSQMVQTSATVAENLGLATNITFPVIDPHVESFTTQSEVCTPSPSDTTTAVVTSAGRTIASTGVQTEDAISMIQKLTNSVHQLNALQSFAAAHNLELVNFGEITIPPAPFPLDVDTEEELKNSGLLVDEDDVEVAKAQLKLEESLSSQVREDPIGECSPPPLMVPQTISQTVPTPVQSPVTPPIMPAVDIDQATESNHDTALTIAAAGGHDELVQLLLARNADIEHRDKKGCTPLILAATAGHATTCQILLDNGAEIEAQSDRTKDTALSLACSSGRQEVVELLLIYNANYEHRNVSDYTPLSLAASGGYVGIIKVLLNHGAEINSRTGSKLGISPLMLAAMNGHVAAVKLLLDMGSDVNAQIETNRNTALTLACFQGRTEVVGLLLDRKASVEHRAKTGLTPLMEAASGGYVEVGRVLVDRGADVNAPPVPSSRDTALTIAADKGHYKFVELLVIMGAVVDVKNKKGCTPLWLASNGGHLDVVQLLAKEIADVNSCDNRGVSCLMSAFRKGHIKVVKWLVRVVSQFPSDSDLKRYMQTLSDKDLIKKLEEAMQIILSAKQRQEAEANKNASILLEQLDSERKKEERRKVAAQKKRDKRKQKKKKKASKDEDCNGEVHTDGDHDDNEDEELTTPLGIIPRDEEDAIVMNDERPDLSTAELKLRSTQKQLKDKKKEKKVRLKSRNASLEKKDSKDSADDVVSQQDLDGLANVVITSAIQAVTSIRPTETVSTIVVAEITKAVASSIMSSTKSTSRGIAIDAEVAQTMATAAAQCAIVSLVTNSMSSLSSSLSNNNNGFITATSPKKNRRAEDGWKEVTRRYERCKKIQIPAALISRVIGRGGCNVNAIRDYTNAHIDIDTNRKKANGDCMVTIKGSQLAIRQAAQLIESLIEDPDRDVSEVLPARTNLPIVTKPMTGLLQTPTTIPPRTPVLTRLASVPSPINVQVQESNIKSSVRLNSYPPAILSKAPLRSGITTVTNTTMSQVTMSTTAQRDKLTKHPPGWGGTSPAPKSAPPKSPIKMSSSPSSSSSVSPRSALVSSSVTVANRVKIVARRTTTTTLVASSAALLTSKPLPQPIGSNRPAKQTGPLGLKHSCPLSSTSVSGSITATLHSTLTNLLSQVATQRSPMIWQEPASSHPQKTPPPQQPSIDTSVSVSSITTSPTSSVLVTKPEIFGIPQGSVLSQSSSTGSSFKGHSRTPSLSPTQSQQSESPTPEEQRPHLNPIGSERGHKRVPSNQMSQMSVLPGLLQGGDAGPSLWTFDYPIGGDPSNWVSKRDSWGGGLVEQIPSRPNSRPLLVNGDIGEGDIELGKDETLPDLLERLSLSDHLNLFQKNEIDLDALMLMSEQDYADIGLPKEPRIKLLKSMHRISNSQRGGLNGSPTAQLFSQQPPPPRILSRQQPPIPLRIPPAQPPHLPPQQPQLQHQLWNGSPPLLAGLANEPLIHSEHSSTSQPPGMQNPMPFNHPQLMSTWRPWSTPVDQ